MELQTMLDKSYVIKEHESIKSSQEWLVRTLSDIDSKSKRLSSGEGEKEESAIIIDRRRLEIEAFGETLEAFMKRKGINYEFEYSTNYTKTEPVKPVSGDSGGLIGILKRSGIIPREAVKQG